jgi:protein-tyrosine phosphatase
VQEKISVLFVCMGNICRSPTAEGVFRHFVAEAGLEQFVMVDSAGTHAYHSGGSADARSSAAAERRGYSLADIRARKVNAEDFEQFDYVIAMDRDNLALLIDQSDARHHHKISLFLEYSSVSEDEVPDPYYGGATGFEKVLDLVEDASRGLLSEIRSAAAERRSRD